MFANSKYMEEIVHFFSFDRFFNALIAVNVYGFWTLYHMYMYKAHLMWPSIYFRKFIP